MLWISLILVLMRAGTHRNKKWTQAYSNALMNIINNKLPFNGKYENIALFRTFGLIFPFF